MIKERIVKCFMCIGLMPVFMAIILFGFVVVISLPLIALVAPSWIKYTVKEE